MALDDKSLLNNKLSPLIEGQVPDFVQSDHPVFVNFLKDYYKFLEAGQLTISTTTDYVALETSSSSYVLEETDGDRIVTELGAGSKGYFVVDETITGSTSSATAKVLIDDSRNSRIFVTSQQKFITGETITGGTSGSTGIVVEYRGNPVQNIQQLLNYADVDNTIYDFLDKMRDSFMTDIPDDLASGISKRKLLKNIKDLYAAKGTSEGHKLFMRILLGENPDIFYPNQYMIKPSAAEFLVEKIMRVLPFENVDGQEVINQVVTGQTSGAIATVVSSIVSQQTSNNFNDSVTEFSIAEVDGTFTDGEIVTAISTINDREVKFTVFGIVSDVNVDNTIKGTLYSKDEVIDLENIGNNFASVVVDETTSGSVKSVSVDDAGTNYEVGDIVTFTSNSVDADAIPATGEVSMIGGGILQETGTLDTGTDLEKIRRGDIFNNLSTDTIVMEDGTLTSLVSFNFILEETREDKFITDGTSTAFTLTNLNANNDTIRVLRNNVTFLEIVNTSVRDTTRTNWTVDGSTLTFSDINDIPTGTLITVRHTQNDFLLLDRTDGIGTDAGHKIESDTTDEILDHPYFRQHNVTNPIVLEYDTFENLGVTSERGSIQKIKINSVATTANYLGKKSINTGYTKLPTITVTSVSGSGAKLLSIPDKIGSIKSVKIIDSGFRYSSSNTPEIEFRSHFIVKDVSGTFVAENTLTTHTGTVKAWDSTTNELVIANFDDTQKIVQEQDGTFQEGVQLEQATELLLPIGFILETEKEIEQTGFTKIVNGEEVTVNEDRIVLDASSVFDPYEIVRNVFSPAFCGTTENRLTKREIIKVTAEYNEDLKTWAFLLDGKKQKNIIFFEGTDYYFDLSDPSLYGNEIGTPIENLQKTFALSSTPDGTNDSGTREITHITTTQKYGASGALDIVRVGAGNPQSKYWTPPKDLLDTSMYLYNSNLVDYTPSSYYDPRISSQGLSDQEQFGTSQAWTTDELYSIQQGYTGAYLKINLPIGTSHLNNYYYYSPNFSDMGGTITIKRKSKVIFGENLSLTHNATDKEEYGFILETGSQDSTGDTDQLIMEDIGDLLNLVDLGGIALEDGLLEVGSILLDSYRSDDISNGLGGVYKLGLEGNSAAPTLTEEDILKSRRSVIGNSVTDSEWLAMFYSITTLGKATTLQEYLNFQNQRNEPTFFMNEEYIPPIDFRPIFEYEFTSNIKGGKAFVEPKDFVKPIPNQSLAAASRTISSAAISGLSRSSGFGLVKEARELLRCCLPVPFFPKNSFNNDGFVLLDSFRENEEDAFLILDGTDANGADAGDLLSSEEVGNTLILDGTDADGTDAGNAVLMSDETGNGNIVLDATASGIDVGDELLLENNLNYIDPITITDSGGASATIEYVERARGTSTVNAISTKTGSYRGINNLLGEDLIRLQDSYYYQDYSYEVIIGDSLTSYIDELKKAVHPAGFQPFGRVSIATLVSVAVTDTAAGVSDYIGDTTTFSPILASALETIFSQVLQSRLQVPTSSAHDGHVVAGSFDDKIVQETGVLPGENLILDVSTEFNLVLDGIDSNSTDAGFAIVLDGTDGSSTDAGDNITILDDQSSNILFEDENLLSELGVDNIVLNGTDDDSSNAGDNIKINAGEGIDLEDGISVTSADVFLYEEATINSTDDITSGTGDAGGRIMSETSYAPSGQADRVIFSTIVKKLESKPLPKFERNLLLYLAETPFGSEPCGITLESGSGNLTDNIVMDGEIPFAEGSAFMELERDSEIDNIILDGTDSLGSNAGEGLILETGFFLKIEDPSLGRESETFTILFEDDGKLQLEASVFAFPTGFRVSDGSKLLLDTLDNDETITLSDIGSLSFSDIRRPDRIEIQGLNANEENWGGATDDDNITLEDFGQILLDGSDSDSTDAGNHLLQETSKRNRFTLEQSGNLIVEVFSSLSNFAAVELESGVQDEIGDDLLLEDAKQENIPFNIKLEDDENVEGIIILNGTDSSLTNANDKIQLEDFFNESPTDYKILLEEHNVFAAEGQIPEANYRLNSTNVITKGNVRSAEIYVRDTGDITLEDATDDTHGFLVLNSTSGSSTNAGENIDLEGATGISY